VVNDAGGVVDPQEVKVPLPLLSSTLSAQFGGSDGEGRAAIAVRDRCHDRQAPRVIDLCGKDGVQIVEQDAAVPL
jgi:hypothetical protein